MPYPSVFTFPFSAPGSATSSLVPHKFPVALNGRPYMLDLKSGAFRHQSIPLLRQQSDDSSAPSEASLNPDDLWRRAQDSWHHGAGQTFRDREDGNPNRFRTSKGVDPWTRYEIKPHFATDQKRSSAATNPRLQPAGTRLYLTDAAADDLVFTTDVTVDSPTWTAVTYAGGDILSITSDGFHVWVTDGANIYETNTGISTTSTHDTLDADVLDYVKGRLMVAHDNSIYDDTLGGTPSALFSHANTDFSWVGFAEGRAAIYAAGKSGDKSLIYRIAIKPDATGLDQPVIAGDLPDGELVTSIDGYLSFILLGTNQGARFCIPDGQGNLEIGGLIETGDAVRCFEGQGPFVWFGWDDYDDVSTGLGRMDLRVITDSELTTLAYASDLMVTTQGDVLSVCTFQDIRVFTVSGSGAWAQDTDLVASGTIESGLIGYGLPDQKVALSCEVRNDALAGSYTVALDTDGGGFSTVGTNQTDDSRGQVFPLDQVTGERFELRFTLTRDAVATDGPTITRWTLLSNPQPAWREFIFWPILLHEIESPSGSEEYFDPAVELAHIKALRRSRQLVVAQEGATSYTVAVEDYEVLYQQQTRDNQTWNSTCVVKLKVVV